MEIHRLSGSVRVALFTHVCCNMKLGLLVVLGPFRSDQTLLPVA